MMEAENTSETLVNFYQTTHCNIPEDSNFQLKNTALVSTLIFPEKHLN
jgi:flagellar basal body P-ring protein FlgI